MITLRYVKKMDIAEFLYNKYLFCISNIMMMLIKICLVIAKGEISLEGHTDRNLRQLLNRAHTISITCTPNRHLVRDSENIDVNTSFLIFFSMSC